MTTNTNEQLIARLVAFTDDWQDGRDMRFSLIDGLHDLLKQARSDEPLEYMNPAFRDYDRGLTDLIAHHTGVESPGDDWVVKLVELIDDAEELSRTAND